MMTQSFIYGTAGEMQIAIVALSKEGWRIVPGTTTAVFVPAAFDMGSQLEPDRIIYSCIMEKEEENDAKRL